MRRRLVVLLILCGLLIGGFGCGAKQAASEPEVAVGEIVTPGEDADVPEAAEESDTAEAESGPPCHGVLSCTFFGLGAAIALPFWVLGAVLGLAF